LEQRAGRRYQENLARGEAADYEQVLASVRGRDVIDSSRAVAPLRPAGDAVVIDTTPLTIKEVLERVLALVAGVPLPAF